MDATVKTLEDWDLTIKKNPLVLAYFSSKACQVCKTIKPQVEAMAEKDFPNLLCIDINVEQQSEIAAQNTVFSIPTVIVYVEGKEHFKSSRFISVGELKQSIEKIYKIIF